MAELRPDRALITEASLPAFPRGVQLRQDMARHRWVLLAPERVLVPDALALDILLLCDGQTSVCEIVEELVQKHAADRSAVLNDVIATLQNLRDKKFLADRRGVTMRDGREITCPVSKLTIEAVVAEPANAHSLPIAMLAELTHRCPLQMPLLLQSGRAGSRQRRTFDTGNGRSS